MYTADQIRDVQSLNTVNRDKSFHFTITMLFVNPIYLHAHGIKYPD